MNQQGQEVKGMEKVRATVAGTADPKDTLGTVAGQFDSATKILGAFAALGGIAYLLALLVVGIRLRDKGLPSHEVLSVIPREQLVVSGTIELLASVVGAAVLVMLAVASRRSLWLQGGLLLTLVLILPFSFFGLVWLAVTGALVALLRSWDSPNVPALVLVFALCAVLLTLTRQAEFPSPFARVKVALNAGSGGDGKAEVRLPPITGRYIGATSDDVLIGVSEHERKTVEKLIRVPVPDSLVMIPRARIDQVVLGSFKQDGEPPESILARLGVELTCLIPNCRYGDRTLVTPQ